MKKLIYTIAFTLAVLVGMAQTNQPLPIGVVPFGATTYLSPLDSTIWLYKERDGTAVNLGSWHKVDSLFGLGYTKAQVDSAIIVNRFDLSDEYQYYEVSRDNTTTEEFSGPKSAMDVDGNIWSGTVSSNGGIYLVKFLRDGRNIRRRIGSIRSFNVDDVSTDTHNSPSLLVDDRPQAEYPLIVFQTEHGTEPLRMWRFTDLDPTSDVPSYTEIDTARVTYAQCARIGDELIVLARSRNAELSTWRAYYSPDNGDTWNSREIFGSSVSPWMYINSNVTRDGNEMYLGFVGHRTNATSHNVYMLRLNLAAGWSLTNLSTTLVADLRDYIINGTGVVDPYSDGLLVYNADASGDITNKVYISDNNSQSVVVNFIRDNRKALGGVVVNRNNGNIVNTNLNIDTAEPGELILNISNMIPDAGSHRKYITFKWNQKSSLPGIDYGLGRCTVISTDNFTVISSDDIVTSKHRLTRNNIVKGNAAMTFCEMRYFGDMHHWASDLFLHWFDDEY